MRAALALIAVSALCAAPAVAQGKAKPAMASVSVQVLEICESFALEQAGAVDAAIAAGWDAYEETGESPFIKSYSGSKEIAGLGFGSFFALVETYPDRVFGYCRADVIEPSGDGEALVKAITDLGRYAGDVVQEGAGSYASLVATAPEQDRVLLTHWTPNAFVVQLSITTARAEAAQPSTDAAPAAGELTAPSAPTTEEK